ncbi:MAG: sulfurtransferase [Melioribacter sp.]|uniref:sulfurtransferase n=1 Tax=Rosettibacter primus TaxID=3111523 RepID=UPI00247E6BBC|nr:sulfurtransferase [Melioribacter sp.]
MESEIKKQYLIEVEELFEILGSKDLVIIDTREPEDYLVDHIPGAINIYEIFTYLSTKENGGYDAMRKKFTELFGKAGIDGSERVIVYEDAMDNGYGRSCRGYFLLKHLGHKNVKVLHGGYQAWIAKNLPVTRQIPNVEEKIFNISIDNSIIVTQEEMLESLTNPDIIKLDCRDHAEWVGTSSSPYGPDFAPRKGRIPGAKWIEWYQTMYHKNYVAYFKEPDELKEIFLKSGIIEESTVYIYCFKGARTSNMFIAMKLAGIKNVKNYLGSWNEWSRNFSLPIERGYPKPKK